MNNKTNIEEDIEQLLEFFNFWNSHGWIPAVNTKRISELRQMLENILADRERLIERNNELKEYISIVPNLDEMTATKYLEIQKNGYFKGRAEEQQKSKQIIEKFKANKYDSLVEKIKECRDNLEKDGFIGYADELQELLDTEK